MPEYPSFENVMIPLDQDRIIDPYQVRIFKDNTTDSHVFLSRVVNSLYTVFGNDIVIDGLNIDDNGISWNNEDGSFTVNPGMLIQDTTLLRLNERTSVYYPRLATRNAEKGRIVVFVRYQYLQTVEPNLFKLAVNFIPTHSNPIPVESFNEDTDRTLIGIFKFEKDENDNITSIYRTEDEYIDIKLASGLRRYWLNGYDPSKSNLKKYISNIISGRSSIIFDNALDGLALVGDILDPGLNKYWGTNWGGTKGWYDIPFSLADTEEQERDLWQFRDINDVKFNGWNFVNLTIDEDDYAEPGTENMVLARTTDIVNPLDGNMCFKLEVQATATGVPGNHLLEIAPGFGGISGYYRASFYARKGSNTKIAAAVIPNLLFQGINTELVYTFDLSTGTSFVFDENGYDKDHGMQLISNGWYKCWFTFEAKGHVEDDIFCEFGIWNEQSPIDDYNGSMFIGTSGEYLYTYGFQITYSEIYHTFNDDDVYILASPINTEDGVLHFVLTGAQSLISGEYEVSVNNEVISNTLYNLETNNVGKIELTLDNSIHHIYAGEDDTVVVIKYLQYALNGKNVKLTQLADTPDSYKGMSGAILQVNNTENGVWFGSVNDILMNNVVVLDKFQSISSTKIFEQDVIIKGNLIVEKSTEQPNINSPIYDNFIILNRGEINDGVSAQYSGMRIYRGPNLPGADLRYNESKKYWEIGYHQSNDYSPILTLKNFTDFKEQLGIEGNSTTHDITAENNRIVLTKDDIGKTIFIRLTTTNAVIELPDINVVDLAEFWIATISVNNSSAVCVINPVNNQRMMYRSEYVPNITLGNGEWINLVKTSDKVWTTQISGQSTGLQTATYDKYGFTTIATMLEVQDPDNAPVDAVINCRMFNDGFKYYATSLMEQLNQDRLSDRVYNYSGDGLKTSFIIDTGSSTDSTKYLVFVGGVYQSPQINYTIEGNQVKFNNPPKKDSPVSIRSSIATEVGQVEYALRVHTHVIEDVDGLRTILNAKAEAAKTKQVLGTFPSRNILFESFNPGSTSFVFPDLYAGKNYYVEVHLKGAGGGGSGAATSTDAAYIGEQAGKTGSGGGEGEYVRFVTVAIPNDSLVMNIGKGGAGSVTSVDDPIGFRGWDSVDAENGEQTSYGSTVIAYGGFAAKSANLQSSYGGLGGGSSTTASMLDQLSERTKGEDGYNGSCVSFMNTLLDSKAGKGGGKDGGNIHVGNTNGRMGCGGSGGNINILTGALSPGGNGGDGYLVIYALGQVLDV